MRRTPPNLPAVRITAVLCVLLCMLAINAHAANSLGSNVLFEAPAAGTDSIVVATSGTWTAVANDAWLRTSATGNGSGVALFSFDANTGATRTGSLTIAG